MPALIICDVQDGNEDDGDGVFWQEKYWFTWFLLIMADSPRATFEETPLVVSCNVVVVVVGGVTNCKGRDMDLCRFFLKKKTKITKGKA